VNRGGEQAAVELRVAGPAAGWATIEPSRLVVGSGAPAAATVTVRVPADAAPGTLPVEVYASAPGGSGASVAARASLVVEPSRSTPFVRRYTRGRTTTVVTVAATIALVLAGIVAAYFVLKSGGGGGGGGGDSGPGVHGVVRRDGLYVHKTPDTDADSRDCNSEGCLVLDAGEDIRVECRNGSMLRIIKPKEVGGDYVYGAEGFVDLDGEVGGC
jgi:hypothetical protein